MSKTDSRAPGRIILPLISIFLMLSCSVFSRESLELTPPQSPGRQWKNDWTHGAVFYEIFVRSFADSNGDGIGDLNGLISKLDYLNDGKPETTTDLGIDAVWLMPVFQSPSYHGYDTTDYRHINPDYGSDGDFDRFLQEAHRRGIRVILDYVVNHTSSEHPWFAESNSSPNSARRDWYVWRADNPGWTQPWGGSNPTWHSFNGQFFYGVFWSGMPDLNFRTKGVRKEILKTATFWLKKGVDGFRLDATRYLVETGSGPGQADTPETHAFLKQLSKKVRKVKPEAAIVGENWTETPVIATYFGSTSTIAGGDELPMNFNFPLASSIVEGVKAGNAAGIGAVLAQVKALYPAGVNDAPFLTNHDQVRLSTQLQKDPSRLHDAASILLTLPGAPFLYYGEEVGLENGPASGDEAKRTPMPWDSSGKGFSTGTPWFPFAPGKNTANVLDQTKDPKSLLSHYRNLIRVRRASVALQKGDLQLLSPTAGASPFLAFIRSNPVENVVVVINLSSSFVAAGPYPVQAVRLDQLFTDGGVPNPNGISGQWTFPMPPHSAGIWRLQ